MLADPVSALNVHTCVLRMCMQGRDAITAALGANHDACCQGTAVEHAQVRQYCFMSADQRFTAIQWACLV